jgi:hypothetical protein
MASAVKNLPSADRLDHNNGHEESTTSKHRDSDHAQLPVVVQEVEQTSTVSESRKLGMIGAIFIIINKIIGTGSKADKDLRDFLGAGALTEFQSFQPQVAFSD